MSPTFIVIFLNKFDITPFQTFSKPTHKSITPISIRMPTAYTPPLATVEISHEIQPTAPATILNKNLATSPNLLSFIYSSALNGFNVTNTPCVAPTTFLLVKNPPTKIKSDTTCCAKLVNVSIRPSHFRSEANCSSNTFCPFCLVVASDCVLISPQRFIISLFLFNKIQLALKSGSKLVLS